MSKHKVTINIDDFTVGDFIDFEDVAGLPLQEAMKKAQAEESLSMKAMLALLWLAERGGGTTIEQVREYKISALEIDFVGGDEEDADKADPQPADVA